MKKVNVKLIKGFVFPGFAGWVPCPRVIVYSPKYAVNRKFLAHELMHVSQWERYSIFFLPLYVLQWVLVGFNYWKIPLEVEARSAEYDEDYLLWADETLRRNKLV